MAVYGWEKFSINEEKKIQINTDDYKLITNFTNPKLLDAVTFYETISVFGNSFVLSGNSSYCRYTAFQADLFYAYNNGYRYFQRSDFYKGYDFFYMDGLYGQQADFSIKCHPVEIKMLRKQGKFIEKIQATNRSAYPNSGIKNGFWYEFTGKLSDTSLRLNGKVLDVLKVGIRLNGSFHEVTSKIKLNGKVESV